MNSFKNLEIVDNNVLGINLADDLILWLYHSKTNDSQEDIKDEIKLHLENISSCLAILEDLLFRFYTKHYKLTRGDKDFNKDF